MTEPEHGERDAGPAGAAGETLAGGTAELPGREGAETPTERRPPVEAEAPRPDAPDEPALRDVVGAAAGYLRGRASLITSLARGHRGVAVALAVIACAVVALLGLALHRALAVPDAATVSADARELLDAPAYDPGTYGVGTSLVTQGVSVRSVTRSSTAPAGTDAQFGASGYATAEVVVTYAGQGVSADQGAKLSYALVNGEWALAPGASDVGVSWHATAGVDQQKVLSNVHLLLARADGGDGEPSLAELYEGAAATVEEEAFDEGEQTDTLEISLVRAGAFSSYECHLSVTFAFGQASGRWEVSSVEVADGAHDRDLGALLGTWQGAFQSQQTDGTKCLAGRAAGLSVTIDEASADGAAISGTVGGLAHYHAHPAADAASCEGDAPFSDVPFSARLVSSDGDALEFEATLPEDVDGTVTLTLRFGTAEDPARVEALVESSFPTTESILFIPVERTLTYTDLFTLARAD